MDETTSTANLANQPTISIGIHPALNRLPRGATDAARKADKRRMNAVTPDGWRRADFTLAELVDHLATGASIAAVFPDGHRQSQGAIAQFIALDFDTDNPERTQIEADAADLRCAVIVGETATAGRYRAIIPLAEQIVDAEQFRDYAARLRLRFRGASDHAGEVIGQPWYGFRGGTIRVFSGEFLSSSTIGGMPAPVRPWRRELPQQSLDDATQDRRAEFVRTEVLPAVERTVTTGRGKHFNCINPDHPDRHPSARIAAGTDGDLLYFCTCGTHSLITAGAWLGLSYNRWLKANYPAEAKQRKPKKSLRRRVEQPGQIVEAVERRAVAHVGDDLTPAEIWQHSTLLIEGGTGLGKSTAIAAYINGLTNAQQFDVRPLPTFLVREKETVAPFLTKDEDDSSTETMLARLKASEQQITAMAQFRLLTSALHRLLNDFSHYEQADGAYQRALGREQRLVTSISSLSKFDRHGGRVVIDEITGVLKFLAGSGTFPRGEALTAYRSLIALLESAVQLVGMDANLDDVTIRFIEKYRGRATVRRYRRAESRGKVTLLSDRLEAVHQIGKLLAHRRGPVFAACSSEATATQIVEHYQAQGYQILKVTRDTASTDRVRAAVQDAELRAGFDLIVYDSACGAGVDFSEQVYAQVAIFDHQPLAPEDAIQLFGRVRHAERRYAAVPPDSEGYPTPTAAELFGDVIKREAWTRRILKVPAQSLVTMYELADLWSQFRERQLRESARWRYYFSRRLQADGFTIAEIDVRAPEDFAATWKEWKADRDDQQWTFVRDAVALALADEDMERLRINGVEITTEHTLRNIRWKIEMAKGIDELCELDRDLMKRQGRSALFRLRDWLSDVQALRDADHLQHVEQRPIHKRRYNALAREVLVSLFKLAGHTGTPEAQLDGFLKTFADHVSAADVEARYGVFLTDEAMNKFRALGHYGTNARTITGLCRWLLEYLGLKLISSRRRVDGKMTMFYRLDDETLTYRLQRARHAAANRPGVSSLIRNIESSLVYINPISSSNTPAYATAQGWAAAPLQFERQFVEALVAPI